MNKTGIEWTNLTWNPVSGCTKASPGCAHCYAEGIAHRFAGSKAFPEGFKVTLHPERLMEPLRRTKPSRIFVNSMSDLFHPDVPFEFIDRVFAVMAKAEQHTFQVLTKRPARMAEYLADRDRRTQIWNRKCDFGKPVRPMKWPLPNVWLGVSVEDQARARERIPLLIQTPAAVRFVSLEPLLGPVDIGFWVDPVGYHCGGEPEFCHCFDGYPRDDDGFYVSLDWVIVGAETGPKARTCRRQWVLELADQVRGAAVPLFIKDNLHWPEPIQQYPEVSRP